MRTSIIAAMARRIEDPGTIAWDRSMYTYPWSDWLDGQIWELTPGEDFKVSVAAFQAMAHKYARNYDMKIRTKQRDGKLLLQLRTDYNPA
jgi:hypothetical protein